MVVATSSLTAAWSGAPGIRVRYRCPARCRASAALGRLLLAAGPVLRGLSRRYLVRRFRALRGRQDHQHDRNEGDRTRQGELVQKSRPWAGPRNRGTRRPLLRNRTRSCVLIDHRLCRPIKPRPLVAAQPAGSHHGIDQSSPSRTTPAHQIIIIRNAKGLAAAPGMLQLRSHALRAGRAASAAPLQNRSRRKSFPRISPDSLIDGGNAHDPRRCEACRWQ